MTNSKDYIEGSNNRAIGIDFLKFLCAVLVILIHVPAKYTEFVLPLTRCAVPCFFIISGYFLYNNGISNAKLRYSLKKTAKIWAYSTIIYLSFSVLLATQGGSWNLLDSERLINFLLFNEHPFAFHLWYIDAYIYVLLIYLVMSSKGFLGGNFVLIWISILLLFVDLLFGKYSVLIFGRTFDVMFTRNFLFVGIPYFTIGIFIKTIKVNSHINRWCTLAVVASIILTYIKKYVVGSYIEFGLRDHYLSSTFLAISVFLYFLTLEIREKNIFSKLGRKCSLDIYILHPLIYWLLLYRIFPCWETC